MKTKQYVTYKKHSHNFKACNFLFIQSYSNIS